MREIGSLPIMRLQGQRTPRRISWKLKGGEVYRKNEMKEFRRIDKMSLKGVVEYVFLAGCCCRR